MRLEGRYLGMVTHFWNFGIDLFYVNFISDTFCVFGLHLLLVLLFYILFIKKIIENRGGTDKEREAE